MFLEGNISGIPGVYMEGTMYPDTMHGLAGLCMVRRYTVAVGSCG